MAAASVATALDMATSAVDMQPLEAPASPIEAEPLAEPDTQQHAGSLTMETTGDAKDIKSEVEIGDHTAMCKQNMKMHKTKKRKSPQKEKPKAQCIGIYVDALDKKKFWAEAKIVDCDVKKRKIRVKFIGWSDKYNLWLDESSIAAHRYHTGQFVKSRIKTAISWDGETDLFTGAIGSSQGWSTNNESPSPPDTKKRKRQPEVEADDGAKENVANYADATSSPLRKQRKPPLARTTSETKPYPKRQPTKPKRTSSTAVAPDTPMLQLIGPEAIDLEAKRQDNLDVMHMTTQFLQQCADIWKRQLCAAATLPPTSAVQ